MQDKRTSLVCFRCGRPVYTGRYSLGADTLCYECRQEAATELEDNDMNGETTITREEFAERLKVWRATWEYTQAEAALCLGVSIDTYRTWEQCVHLPKADDLESILEKTKLK